MGKTLSVTCILSLWTFKQLPTQTFLCLEKEKENIHQSEILTIWIFFMK